MSPTTDKRGYFLIEARWERSKNAPGEDAFFLIDELGGSLDDAKRAAETYLFEHVASGNVELEWIEGINRKKRAYYAHKPFITFRITS